MRTSLNPLMYKDWGWSKLYETPGTFTLNLSPGVYTVMMRGAGGAGGEAGTTAGGAGGSGGAGGTGQLLTQTVSLSRATTVTVYIGSGGLTKSNGGNGGDGGSRANAGGGGGGGGRPTYIKIYDRYIASLGGGGGGGGGAGARVGRYQYAGSGGGGGGFYRLGSDGTITSVSGQTGGNNGGTDDGNGGAGVAGNIIDFPNIYSGSGAGGGDSDGYRTGGGSGKFGGGASGGGGGAGTGNHSTAQGGGGGGGAGGDLDAGGGAGGNGFVASGQNGYNFKITPTASTNWEGDPSNLGQGGIPGQNGYGGWLYIVRTSRIPLTEWNLGSVAVATTETTDCGSVDDATDQILDMGTL